MTVLLATDVIAWSRPARTLDEHGWATADVVTPRGSVIGSVQEYDPESDPTLATGGAGPTQPATQRAAKAYLDVGDVQPGDLLTCRGITWQVKTVSESTGPLTMLACWVADCREWQVTP